MSVGLGDFADGDGDFGVDDELLVGGNVLVIESDVLVVEGFEHPLFDICVKVLVVRIELILFGHSLDFFLGKGAVEEGHRIDEAVVDVFFHNDLFLVVSFLQYKGRKHFRDIQIFFTFFHKNVDDDDPRHAVDGHQASLLY